MWHLDPSSRLATRHGPKIKGAVPHWGMDPHLTQCLRQYQVDPSSRLATTDMGRKLGAAVPLLGEAGSPCNIMLPGPSPTQVQSRILSMQPFDDNT